MPRQAAEIRIRHRNGTARSTTGRIVFHLFVVCSLAFAAPGNQADAANAKVEGSVFVRDSAGKQSFVAGAIVKFSGPATFKTESDENGEYVIAAMPPGTYAVEAVFAGLKAAQTVPVEASEVHVPVELKPAELTSSVVVTPDQAETKNPGPSETISDKTLRDAPNVE